MDDMAASKKPKKSESTAAAPAAGPAPAAPPVYAEPKPGSDEAYMKRIKAARAALLMRNPFFGYLALKLNPELDDSVKTAATDGSSIFWSRQFMDTLNDHELLYVTAHEVMHCALEHLWRTGGRDPQIANAAQDMVVNDMLNEAGVGKMPAQGLTGAHGKSFEQVYEELLDKYRKDPKGGKGGKGKPGDGSDGSGGVPKPLDNHDDWYKKEARNDPNSPEGRQLRDGWKAALAQAKSYGNVPSVVSQIIDAILYAKVDWRQVLVERFTKTAADYSWKPVDRRLLGAGILIPSLSSSETRVVIAIDTSGSVPDALIAQFWAEVSSILRNYGVKARIMTCDTEIGDEWQEWEFEPNKAKVSRRGGTSFRAPFARLEKYQAEGWEPSLLVYMTDLEGDFPDQPFGVDVIWAIPPSSKNHKAPFGTKLVID